MSQYAHCVSLIPITSLVCVYDSRQSDISDYEGNPILASRRNWHLMSLLMPDMLLSVCSYYKESTLLVLVNISSSNQV